MGVPNSAAYGAASLINAKNICAEKINYNAQSAINSLDKNSGNYNQFVRDIESDQRSQLSKVESIFSTLRRSASYLPEGMLNSPLTTMGNLSEAGFNSLIAQADAARDAYARGETVVNGQNVAKTPENNKDEVKTGKPEAGSGFANSIFTTYKVLFQN